MGKRAQLLVSLALQSSAALVCELTFGLLGDHLPISSRLARGLSLILIFFVVQLFAEKSLDLSKDSSLKDLVTFYCLLVVSLVVTATSYIFALGLTAFMEKNGLAAKPILDSLFFALPFAVGALLAQVVLGLRASLMLSLFLGVATAIYVPNRPLAFAYVLCTSLAGAISLVKFRSRSDYLKAGLSVSLTAVAFSFASLVIEQEASIPAIAIRLAGSLVAGVLAAVLAAGITPLVEYLGKYATDMRLIEIATLDHPLLNELSVQAPGTWNHSMVMGMMVESAAEAIGANSVVCRVGAYFHDVGKTKKPLYFVENQIAGENRHDKLSPSMSALIIRSHVKEGVELAREYGVPKIIEDMIPQHHGTSQIEFFLEKARREAEENGEDPDLVDTSLYSYPGPMPQTKEAGLLMLADGIEAAARTLSDSGHDRIQGMVQKMINKVFASGQLAGCELTLRDLHLIAKCFTRVLVGIYHQRIAYADPAEKGVVAEAAGEANGEPVSEEKEEDLKRLGI